MEITGEYNGPKKHFYVVGKNDECYTPTYCVSPILEFIPKDSVIWCPFDKPESEFVKVLSEKNKVIYSHIHNGQDFLTYEPDEHWDIIVSNPPFANKIKFFKRAISFGKPFALIMNNGFLSDSGPAKIFGEDLQLLMFNKRMRFIKPDGTPMKSPPFGSSYFCYKLLPKPIIFRELRS